MTSPHRQVLETLQKLSVMSADSTREIEERPASRSTEIIPIAKLGHIAVQVAFPLFFSNVAGKMQEKYKSRGTKYMHPTQASLGSKEIQATTSLHSP